MMRTTQAQVHAGAVSPVRRGDAVRGLLGLGFLGLAAWLAFTAMRVDALSELTAHAGWCASGAGGDPPAAVAAFLDHCALCWESVAAAFAGGVLLTVDRRP